MLHHGALTPHRMETPGGPANKVTTRARGHSSKQSHSGAMAAADKQAARAAGVLAPQHARPQAESCHGVCATRAQRHDGSCNRNMDCGHEENRKTGRLNNKPLQTLGCPRNRQAGEVLTCTGWGEHTRAEPHAANQKCEHLHASRPQRPGTVVCAIRTRPQKHGGVEQKRWCMV